DLPGEEHVTLFDLEPLPVLLPPEGRLVRSALGQLRLSADDAEAEQDREGDDDAGDARDAHAGRASVAIPDSRPAPSRTLRAGRDPRRERRGSRGRTGRGAPPPASAPPRSRWRGAPRRPPPPRAACGARRRPGPWSRDTGEAAGAAPVPPMPRPRRPRGTS